MAIIYPLSLPTVSGIASIRLMAKNVVGVVESPFSLNQQVIQHQGQRWEADVSLPPMKRDDAEEWVSFLVSLKGQYGTFLLGDPLSSSPRGVGGTPIVNGGNQTGSQLDIIDASSTNVSSYLKAGDYIQLGSGSDSQLYKILQTVSTDGSGQTTLDIWPNLRSTPTNLSTVTLNSPKGLFRLASNEISWDVNTASLYGVSFGAVEAL